MRLAAAYFVNVSLFPSDYEALFIISWRRNHLLDDLFPPEQTLPPNIFAFTLSIYYTLPLYIYIISFEDHELTLALWRISQQYTNSRKVSITGIVFDSISS